MSAYTTPHKNQNKKVNPFVSNTSFSDVFRGYRKGALGQMG